MKNAYILHGTGGTPDSYWQPYLAHALTQKGYQVSVPQLPGTNNPHLSEQSAYVEAHCVPNFNEATVLVGHSSGVPLILHILEHIHSPIKHAVLVAGFYKPLPGNEGSKQMLPEHDFDWKKIQAHTKKCTVLNSENDPWGCNDTMGRELAEKLHGEFIFMKGEGHMGSSAFNQPYREFPKLLELIV